MATQGVQNALFGFSVLGTAAWYAVLTADTVSAKEPTHKLKPTLSGEHHMGADADEHASSATPAKDSWPKNFPWLHAR